MASRVYKLVTRIPARGQMGAVNTTDTETITEERGGVRVDTHVTGTIEGTHVDRRSSKFYPGVTLEAASDYRRKHGYTLVSSIGGATRHHSTIRWDDSPGAWQRGYEFAKESALHETRAEQRKVLQRLANASSAYDRGFAAGYQDVLGVPRSSSTTGRRSHLTKKRWSGTEVQSLLFMRPAWTTSKAKAWAKKHGYRYGDIDVTDRYVHLRQFDPVPGTEKRTQTFGKGIKAVIEQVK